MKSDLKGKFKKFKKKKIETASNVLKDMFCKSCCAHSLSFWESYYIIISGIYKRISTISSYCGRVEAIIYAG